MVQILAPSTKNEIMSDHTGWTPDQVALIIKTVARGATPDELQLFLYRCKNMGLDPLKPGRVHFIKYGTNPGSIVVGIEGFRTFAARTEKLSGIQRGVIKDDKGVILGGWCEVHRKDWSHPAREEVPFNEYNTGKGIWAKMPETMIKKCAEAAALRMAFPEDLGGVYEAAELDKAQASRGAADPGDGFQKDGYHFGSMGGPRLAQRHVSDVPTEDLKKFISDMDLKYEGREMPLKTHEAHEKAIEEILKREGFEIPEPEIESEEDQESDNFGIIK